MACCSKDPAAEALGDAYSLCSGRRPAQGEMLSRIPATLIIPVGPSLVGLPSWHGSWCGCCAWDSILTEVIHSFHSQVLFHASCVLVWIDLTLKQCLPPRVTHGYRRLVTRLWVIFGLIFKIVQWDLTTQHLNNMAVCRPLPGMAIAHAVFASMWD